jgi:uncharacterized protein (TIGR03086 family)
MNDAKAFQRASDGFVERARQVRADQWSAATPCTEWDVRALVNHVAGEYLWVPEMIAGKTIAEVGNRLDGDLLGDDPLQALLDAHRGAVDACAGDGAMDKTVHLSFGDVPAAEYARQMTVDSTIHSWDLARAIGANETLDAELVELSYAEMQKSAEDWRSAGAFGPKTEPSGESTQAKLLALTGR